MYKYFRQKYKRCLDPYDEKVFCFSTEHFSYDSYVQVKKRDLSEHYTYWVAKYRMQFYPLFESMHLNDEVRTVETNTNLIQKSIDRQILIMKQACSKALEDLGTEQMGKMLHMRLGNPTHVPDSLRAEALIDKLLRKHAMLCAYNNSKMFLIV